MNKVRLAVAAAAVEVRGLPDGDRLVNTGKSLQLPGQPASMRGRTR